MTVLYDTRLSVSSGSYGHYQASQTSSGSSQSCLWSSQSATLPSPTLQYGSNRPAPGPAPPIRQYAPIAHPYKSGVAVYVYLTLRLFVHYDAQCIGLKKRLKTLEIM